MLGAEVVAIISVSAGALATLLTTCFHSRCTKIKTPCFECDRKLFDEEEIQNHRKNNKVNLTSLKGYFAEAKLTNNSKEKAELFAVGSEVSQSSK